MQRVKHLQVVENETSDELPSSNFLEPPALPFLRMTRSNGRHLNDMEGWVFLRRRFLSKRRRLYLRLNGSVITVHQTTKAPIDWDASILNASLHFSPRRFSILLILATGSRIYLQPHPRDTCQNWLQAFQSASSRHFEQFYTLQEKIGEGAFASVHKATRTADNTTVAVKLIKKKQFDMQMARELQREMYTMKNISHPALIFAHDVFNTPDTVLIVMDYMKGGTLKDIIQMNGAKISEQHALPIVTQVLDACAYLHTNGYVHRDLKLENVLCEHQEIAAARVRLADFGYVNFVDHFQHFCLRSLVGTPVYVAPEIISRHSYGTPVDVYAVGVMLHRMLVGYYPFEGKDDEKTLALALKGNLRLDGKAWQNISQLCKDFVQALLQPDPEERITAADALQHPWLHSGNLQIIPERPSIPVASTGSDSPVLMSPVTPDLSLAVKASHEECEIKSLKSKLPSVSSDQELRETNSTSSEKIHG